MVLPSSNASRAASGRCTLPHATDGSLFANGGKSETIAQPESAETVSAGAYYELADFVEDDARAAERQQ